MNGFDLVVRGGTVFDGSGRPGRRADIGLEGDRIAAVGDLASVRGREELEADDLAVCPGFIDVHSHSDFTLLVDPRGQSQVAQGVTTEVVGNCGHGCAPIADPSLVIGNIYGYLPHVDMKWRSVDGYLRRLEEARPAVNVATLVPNGNLRLAAVGLQDRPARADELARMVRLLEEGLEQGAFGFSSGLEYPAERACSEEELTELCRAVARRGGLYATHTRNRDVAAVEAIEEGIRVARGSGARLQVSHIIPRRAGDDRSWQEAIEAVDQARANGLDVAFDSHTRLHGITNLSTALPPDVLDRPPRELAARLRDPTVRRELKRYPSLISSFGLGGWERVFLFSSAAHPEWVRRSLAELAPPGGDALDAVYDILADEVEDIHSVMCICHSYEEDWLRTTFRHPLCMPGSDATALCTDGPLAGSTFLGAYTWAAWYLRRLVRECGDLSLGEAVRRLTALPAERVGLRGRGHIEKGFWADLVVFDPASVAERGTLEDPNQLAVGVRHVVVNGQVTMKDGRFTGQRAGRVLRRDDGGE